MPVPPTPILAACPSNVSGKKFKSLLFFVSSSEGGLSSTAGLGLTAGGLPQALGLERAETTAQEER